MSLIYNDIKPLIGKRIARVVTADKHGDACVILFDDGETYIQLDEQDYYSYHDCSPSARNLSIYSDKTRWKHFNENYEDARQLA